MGTEAPTAAPTPEDVQHEMADTREHLTDQVQALGDRFLGMADDANTAVAGALRGGRDAVRDAVQRVATDGVAYARRALDVRGHVRRHPWLAVGCAAALGFYCSRFLRR